MKTAIAEHPVVNKVLSKAAAEIPGIQEITERLDAFGMQFPPAEDPAKIIEQSVETLEQTVWGDRYYTGGIEWGVFNPIDKRRVRATAGMLSLKRFGLDLELQIASVYDRGIQDAFGPLGCGGSQRAVTIEPTRRWTTLTIGPDLAKSSGAVIISSLINGPGPGSDLGGGWTPQRTESGDTSLAYGIRKRDGSTKLKKGETALEFISEFMPIADFFIKRLAANQTDAAENFTQMQAIERASLEEDRSLKPVALVPKIIM